MYWTENALGKIQRANLNGTDVEALVITGLPGPAGIALDLDDDFDITTKVLYFQDENGLSG
jgi:hypothetical protein